MSVCAYCKIEFDSTDGKLTCSKVCARRYREEQNREHTEQAIAKPSVELGWVTPKERVSPEISDIESGVPIPPRPKRPEGFYRKTVRSMKPGDRRLTDNKTARSLRRAAKQLGIECTTRTVRPGTVSFWINGESHEESNPPGSVLACKPVCVSTDNNIHSTDTCVAESD